MMRARTALLPAIVLLTAIPARAQNADPAAGAPAGAYELDGDHARLVARVHVGFWRYPMTFSSLSGSFGYDPANWRSTRVEITVDPRSVTGDRAVVGMLQADKYPVIQFSSTCVRPAGAGRGELTGDLTLHGVPRPA